VARRVMIGLGLLPTLGLAAATPARAECLGSCLDDMVAALVSLLVYGLIGIVLLVMLIRAKWRRVGLWSLAVVAVLAVGVPLVSQGWIALRLRAVESREVVGTPPPMSDRTPLMIAPDEYCLGDGCATVLDGRGAAGVHVVLSRNLQGVDLTQPVPIADLPLEYWSRPAPGGEAVRRDLTPSERQAVAGQIDYLIVVSRPYYMDDPGPVEAGLRLNPALGGMGEGEAVRLLLAPLATAEARLSLATLRFDLLDLTLQDRPLAIPLAPRNRRGAGNAATGTETAARAICPLSAGQPDANCLSLLER
jgi:hypothetical protein